MWPPAALSTYSHLGGRDGGVLARGQVPGTITQVSPGLGFHRKNTSLPLQCVSVYDPKPLPRNGWENSLLLFLPGAATITREFNSGANFLFNNIDFIIFTTYRGDRAAESCLTSLCARLRSASLRLLTSLSLSLPPHSSPRSPSQQIILRCSNCSLILISDWVHHAFPGPGTEQQPRSANPCRL